MIMNKPIKVLSSRRDIISHYLFKSFIVCDDEQVDHYNIAKLKSIDHIRNIHIAKGIKENEGYFRIFL